MAIPTSLAGPVPPPAPARQAVRLKELEKKADDDLRKKRRDWTRDVAHMREEILRLLPANKEAVVAANDAGSPATTAPEPFIARRRGSTDVLDVRKMHTLFLEYPDGGRRCKMRFDVAGFEADDLGITTDGERIIVRGTRLLKEGEPGGGAGMMLEAGLQVVLAGPARGPNS